MNETNTNDARQVPPARETSAATLANALMGILNNMDVALVLVSGDGALRYANRLGLHELTSGGALEFTHGLVRSRQASEQRGLQQAVGEAVRGRYRLMTLGHEGTSVPLSVIPIPAEEDGETPLALLTFGRQSARDMLTLDFYARNHRLTGAETQVLKGLCSGLRPKEIAQQRSVAISTIRSHIGSIRQKTQTASIRDLVNRVASLPPITPAVRGRLPSAPSADRSMSQGQ